MVSQLDLRNSITLKTSSEITEICMPLFEYLEINFFDFLRVYNDQGHICLTTDAAWNEHYYKMGYYMETPHEHYKDKDISQYRFKDRGESFSIISKDQRENFNKDHDLFITRKCTHYKDTFTIAADPKYTNIIESYLRNLDIIEKFIDFFMLKASPIIHQAEKEKFYFPSPATDKYLTKDIDQNMLTRNFLNKIKFKKLTFMVDNKLIYLTRKEMECLKGLLVGKTRKLIAYDMQISFRTVNTHFDNIKSKLKCYSKDDILKKLLQNSYLRNYLLNL